MQGEMSQQLRGQGSEFSSQQPHGDLQPLKTKVLRNPMPSSDICGHQIQSVAQINRQNTHTQKKNLNKENVACSSISL